MNTFANALRTWGMKAFESELIAAITGLGVNGLPLQKALTQGSVALDDDLAVRVLSTNLQAHAQGDFLHCKVSVQYTSIITGCSCIDDPSPLNILPEYCELLLVIDRQSGDFTVTLLD
ncbi:MAG: hypothetical protein ACYC3A_08120 [Halothiobacillus sp.]